MFGKSRDRNELFDTIGISSAELLHNKQLCFKAGSRVRLMSVVRLTGRPRIPEESELARASPSFLFKLRDFFSGLQKRGIACIYTLLLEPANPTRSSIRQLELDVARLRNRPSDRELLQLKEQELQRLREGQATGYFQTEILLWVWVDGKEKQLDKLSLKLEEQVKGLLASLTAVFPEMDAVLAEGKELLRALSSFFCPAADGGQPS